METGFLLFSMADKRRRFDFSLVLVPAGCNDAFVEVGMPRSPSHSGNAGDLKQMLGPSKVSCAKRQTVELLQGTKNSHLQYVCSFCWEEMMVGEFILSSVAKTLTQVRLDLMVGFSMPSHNYILKTQ